MKPFFLPTITKAMNAYLGLDPESKNRLKKLRGHTIAFELLPFHFTFQCTFDDKGVTLLSDESLPVDAKIRGTPIQMMTVAINKDHRQRFFAEDLVIEGNAEIGQQVIEIFDELNIDWEDHFSRAVGDVPAYHVNRFMRNVGQFLRQTNHTFTQNMDEFLHEEIEWFPSREALQDFFNDIDTLRMDVDRAEAKIMQLSEKITENKESQ